MCRSGPDKMMTLVQKTVDTCHLVAKLTVNFSARRECFSMTLHEEEVCAETEYRMGPCKVEKMHDAQTADG